MKNEKQIYCYPAIFYFDKENCVATFPDLKDLLVQGNSFEDAYKKATETLSESINSAIKEGIKLPTSSNPNDILSNVSMEDFENAKIIIVHTSCEICDNENISLKTIICGVLMLILSIGLFGLFADFLSLVLGMSNTFQIVYTTIGLIMGILLSIIYIILNIHESVL